MTLCKAGIADKAFFALADNRRNRCCDDALCQQNSRQVGQILVEDTELPQIEIAAILYAEWKFISNRTDFRTKALTENYIGYGCALSLVSAVIFALVAILFNKFSERMKNVY